MSREMEGPNTTLIQDKRLSIMGNELKMKSRVGSLQTDPENIGGQRRSYVQENIPNFTEGEDPNKTLFVKELSKYLNISQNISKVGQSSHKVESEANTYIIENREKEVFITHLRRINPTLFFGNIFVDGLFNLVHEEVAFKLLGVKKPYFDLNNIISSCTNKSILEYFWSTPDYEEDYNTYKYVSSSFMNYIFSIEGKQGLTKFFRKLNFTSDGVAKFRLKGKSLIDLEISWKKFAQAGISAEYNYNLYRFIWRIFRYHIIQHYVFLLIIFCFAISDCSITAYNLHVMSLILDGLKTASFLKREFNLSDPSNYTSALLLQFDNTIHGVYIEVAKLVGIYGALVIFLPIGGVVEGLFGTVVGKKLRIAIQTRILNLSVSEYKKLTSTFLIVAFKQDVNNIEYVVANTLGMLVRSICYLLIAYINGFVVHFSYPIYFTMMAVVINSIMLYVSHLSKRYLFKNSIIQGQFKDMLVENYEGVKTIQCYNVESYWMERYDRVLKMTKQFRKRWTGLFLVNLIRSIFRALAGVHTVLSFYLFAILTLYVTLGFDEIYRTYTYFLVGIVRISLIINDMPSIYNAALSLGRLDSLQLDLKKRKPETEKNELNLTFANMSTAFPRSKSGVSLASLASLGSIDASSIRTPRIVLEDVSLTFSVTAAYWSTYKVNMTIPYRSKVALVGQSGSGKSTLLNLITGMLSPTEGSVIINDKPLAEYHSLHKLYGVVHQFSHIFNMSIKENIKLSRTSATDSEVIEVAKKCLLHDWVMSLPRKYDTIVDKGATNISGGQRQRLAIARLLIYRPKVIVVDECTSHLDPSTAKHINNSLFEFSRGRTLIYSTNILERMEDFDGIYVVENGAVVESGNHGELITKNKVYARLYGKYQTARDNQAQH